MELCSGHATYGQDLGIIMLDCAFPRPVGDIGNARSFPFPVRYEVLEGVAPPDLIHREAPEAVARLLEAARRLERAGVRAILTSCGLFLRYQARLADSVRVPVAASSLVLLPSLTALLPGDRKVGVLTAHAGTLAPLLSGWADPGRVALAGMEKSPAFRDAILAPRPPYLLDQAAIQREVLAAVQALLAREPDVGVLLVECTNLCPYSPAIRETTRLPVVDVLDLARLLQRATSGE